MKLLNSFFLATILLCSPTFAQVKMCGNQIGLTSCDQGSERFMAKGVCYQPEENVDPLSDDKIDTITQTLIPALKTIGVNIIRVYQVCPGGNCASHDQVMKALQDNNIQVFVELADYKNGTQCTVDRSTGNYPQTLYDCFTKKIDAFSKYRNVFGFSVGNEVWMMPHKIDDNYLMPSATMKALIRDMKAYIKKKNYNKPVGVALRDVPDVTIPLAYYYACHLQNEKEDTSADFIGYNVYRWGQGTEPGNYPRLLNPYAKYRPVLSISDGGDGDGDKMMNGFKDINVPIILTEFGRPDTPRLFAQVDWMFQEGANLINGGMVFRLVQKKGEDQFGLYEDNSLQTPTPNGGLNNLITEYNEKTPLMLGEGVNLQKITCDPSKFPGMDSFQLDPEQLPKAGGDSQGTHELSFDVGNLKLPLTNISINYEDSSGWHSAVTIPNPSKQNYKGKIPDPKTLKSIGFNFNDTLGACLVKPANLLCKDASCNQLKTVSAAWSANGQGPCTLK
ncbi:hypothetical protein ACTAZI_15150 [Legionella bozemanae]|uniref:hypothetical protein n=1 Tax=Legionella bozemanae TaxID=447 RepID=UPI003EECA14F